MTTFNIPDLRGRLIAGQDNMGGSAAGRIGTVTTDSGTIVGTMLGSAAGSATHAQTSAKLAVHTHTATSTVTDPGHLHSFANIAFAAPGGGVGGSIGTGGSTATTTTNNTGITVATTNAHAGSGNAMALPPSTMILSKIVRIQ